MTFILILTLLFAKPDCREIERITGGVGLEWLGYERGGWDLPDDLKRTSRIDLAEGGIWEYRSPSQRGMRWIWFFFDYELTTDANGDHLGAHNFCAVKIIEN